MEPTTPQAINPLRTYSNRLELHTIDPLYTDLTYNDLFIVNRQIEAAYKKTAEQFYLDVCTPNARARIRKTLHLTENLEITPSGHFIYLARRFIAPVAAITLTSLLLSVSIPLINSINPHTEEPLLSSPYATITIGGGVSLSCAASSCIFGLKYFLTNGRNLLVQAAEFQEWKRREIKETYDLFTHCLKNKMGETALHSACGYTYLPETPVTTEALGRTNKRVVYEKSFIEMDLDFVWERVATTGCNPTELFAEKLHTQPFKKEDLIYAHKFARKVVRILKDIAMPELQRYRIGIRVHPEEVV